MSARNVAKVTQIQLSQQNYDGHYVGFMGPFREGLLLKAITQYKLDCKNDDEQKIWEIIFQNETILNYGAFLSARFF